MQRDGLRAGDADRERVAERLRGALDEGRLDLHEYDDRLQRLYTSRTYSELDALVADLPRSVRPRETGLAPVGAAEEPVPGGAALPSGAARWLVTVWGPWLRVVPTVVVVWAVTSVLAGVPLHFWPAWVAGPWGAVLLVRSVSGITTGEPARWANERARRRARKAAKRERRRERRRLAPAGTDPVGELSAGGPRVDPDTVR